MEEGHGGQGGEGYGLVGTPNSPCRSSPVVESSLNGGPLNYMCPQKIARSSKLDVTQYARVRKSVVCNISCRVGAVAAQCVRA